MSTYGGAPLTPTEIQEYEAKAAQHGWPMEVLVSLDQTFNVLLFHGMLDETMSSHFQRMADGGNDFGKAASWVLGKIQNRHGQKAQAGDLERGKQVQAVEDQSLGVSETVKPPSPSPDGTTALGDMSQAIYGPAPSGDSE
jgi:hypothetical protein